MGENRIAFAPQAAVATTDSATAARKPRIESKRLFEGSSEIVIVHRDEEYSLRITKNGKLILTK